MLKNTVNEKNYNHLSHRGCQNTCQGGAYLYAKFKIRKNILLNYMTIQIINNQLEQVIINLKAVPKQSRTLTN